MQVVIDATSCPSVNSLSVQHAEDQEPTAADADFDDNPAFLETCDDTITLGATAVVPAENSTGTWSYNGLLYIETFGIHADGAIFDADKFGWTRDISGGSLAGGDHFEVRSNSWEANNTDGIMLWESSTIDISGIANFDISLDAFENTGNEANDWIELYYQIDANPEVQVGARLSADFTSATLTTSAATGGGSSLTIRVKMDTRSTVGDAVNFDNVTLYETGANIINFSDVNDPAALVTGLPTTPFVVTSTDLTWTVTSEFGVCPSTFETITINSNPAPFVDDPLPQLCEDTYLGDLVTGVDLTIAAYSDVITGIVGSVGRTIEYYNDAARNNPADLIPDPTNVNINNGTIIYTKVIDTSTSPFTMCETDGIMTFTVISQP